MPATLRGQEARGPLEVRETWLLAQPRLTLPALSPTLAAAGHSELQVDGDWGNDLGWEQSAAGETPAARSFLVDGEHRVLGFAWRRGLTQRLEVGLRQTLLWRGGGTLDGVIGWFHGFTRKLGLAENGRPSFARDELRVLGRDLRGQDLAWSGDSGTGLGDLELQARYALLAARPEASGWPLTLIARATLPTATGPFDGHGVEAGVQLVSTHRLGRRWDVYLGIGATAHSQAVLEGLRYAHVRPQGFFAFEWRAARRLSVLAQVDAAGRLIMDVAEYPSLQSYLRLGGKLDVTPRWRLTGGFTENIKNQQATTDFGVFLGLARIF